MSSTVVGWLFGGGAGDHTHRGPRDRPNRDRAGVDSTHPEAVPEARSRTTASIGEASVGELSPAELVARVRVGDQTAFQQLYDALFFTLWRVAVFQVSEADLAKDIVHDLFLTLWVRRETLPPDLDLLAYCVTAVRNRSRNVRKHARIANETENAVTHARLDPPGIGQAFPPANAEAESSELRAIYQQALTDLDERERTVAILRWEKDFSFEQIAQVLGITKMGARHIALRVQRKLQDRFSAYRP